MIAEMPISTAETPQSNSGPLQPKVKTYHISRENASELARLMHAKRKERAAMLALNPPMPAVASELQPAVDTSAERLKRVQDELIERMTGNYDAKAVSALAQALKNVREVYHLVTGQAKPGVLKTDQRQRRQPQAQVAIEVDSDPVPPPTNPPTV